MSFNISGIAVSGNYIEKVKELEQKISCELVFEQEVLLETASENWKEKGICDICFLDSGTIIFLPVDSKLSLLDLGTENAVVFTISDAGQTYRFEKYINGKLVRSFKEKEGKKLNAHGERLNSEAISKTTPDFIWSEISEVLGQNFWAVPTDHRAYRYKFMTKKLKKKLEEESTYDPKPVVDLKVKPWWKLW